MSISPETRYARNGAIHLAYQVLGSGPPNLLVVQSGPNSHVDHNWTEPSLARFIRRLASFSRLILYDNRGVGLSDPVPGGAAPTMDEQVDDIRAILDETGCRRVVLMGNWAGCASALVFAATYPGRVESLILLGGYARLRAGDGYPGGLDQADIDQIFEAILATWGTGADLDLIAPSVAGDDNFRRWYAQVQRLSASPATAAAMARLWYEVDVRSVPPSRCRLWSSPERIRSSCPLTIRATWPITSTARSTSSCPVPTCSTSPATPTRCWMRSRNSSPACGRCPARTGSWARCCSWTWPGRPGWPPRSATAGSAS